MKNINDEIQRLLDIKEKVDNFNAMRKVSSITLIPISQARFDNLAAANKLDSDIFYYIFDKDIGQYIDGYLD